MMKTILILDDVSIPGAPGLSKGETVRMGDETADMLIDRGFAEPAEDIEATEAEVQKNADRVKVGKIVTPKGRS